MVSVCPLYGFISINNNNNSNRKPSYTILSTKTKSIRHKGVIKSTKY